MSQTLHEIKELHSRISDRILSKLNVTGTGIGYKRTAGRKTGDLCIICSVENKVAIANLPERDKIPAVIDGIPTDVQPTGTIYALGRPTGRFRPAPGGVSAGHVGVTAGTLGCLVRSKGRIHLLSNNHVLANSNMAGTGDMVLQPAPLDGGTPDNDQIARLTRFIPIIFEQEEGRSLLANTITGIFNFFARISGSATRLEARKVNARKNLVDCAIAEPFNEGEVSNEILGIGTIAGTAGGELNMEIKKSGRTTGLTTGIIEQTDATVRVNFGAGKTALFTDQLIAGAMSRGGDSGSVILNSHDEIVGLLFAGSSNTTIINRIQNVFNLLDITLP
ncbi:MAG: hypothetical protein EA408_11180 [Marinilabiliales bacterium]|nr:MAG: hypothetical protein EA408_11180 [Marinilabiliales bacterium]